MSAYEMDNLQDADQFGALVSANVGGLILTLKEEGMRNTSESSNGDDRSDFNDSVKLLEKMLTTDFEKRPSMRGVYTSSWVGGQAEPLPTNSRSTSRGSSNGSISGRSLSRTSSRDSLLGSVLLKRPLSAGIERRTSVKTAEALEGTFAGRAALIATRPLSASSDRGSSSMEKSESLLKVATEE